MAKVRTVARKRQRDRARALREDDTEAEARLWAVLRDRRLGGWKWRRQVPVGPFIADFMCEAAGLVVELDGGQHAEQEAYDARRTAALERAGFRVIRFWNSQVLENRDGVCLTILNACGGDRPGWDPMKEATARFPLPPAGEG
ncbi:endonuclease domain-containing protein [Phenylobacterium sp.]|jgi:very-short-patch-repair endonuclease|uniref:endonuclease domain-containing protein n=1 Tax=Phenylobacterium sp. TaxID=1871053 RepID=UPI002F944CF6